MLTLFCSRSSHVWRSGLFRSRRTPRSKGESNGRCVVNNGTYPETQDYDLSAVFMRNWDTRDESGTDRGCEWEKDWDDVQKVCNLLDIPCKLVSSCTLYNLWSQLTLEETGGSLQRVLDACI